MTVSSRHSRAHVERCRPDHWRDQASCRASDPDLFFPVGTKGDASRQIQAAKTVCESCPVRVACLRFALETNQEAGIWGGTSEDERRELRGRWLVGRRPAVRVLG